MKLNISKLRRKVINSFVPIGESLRNEGLSDNEIVRAFNNHMDLKVRNYYKSLDRNISRVVLSLVKPDSAADSKAEVIFYDKLVKEEISFQFQYEISPYRVDFLINGFLIVEIDGPHHNNEKQKIYDKKRDKYLEKYGYTVVRYPIWLIAMDIDAVVEQIRDFKE